MSLSRHTIKSQVMSLPTVAFMGWFGLLSVFLHGLSSVPLVAAYSRWYTAHVGDHPGASEAKPTIMSRLRHHPSPEETEPEKTEPRSLSR